MFEKEKSEKLFYHQKVLISIFMDNLERALFFILIHDIFSIPLAYLVIVYLHKCLIHLYILYNEIIVAESVRDIILQKMEKYIQYLCTPWIPNADINNLPIFTNFLSLLLLLHSTSGYHHYYYLVSVVLACCIHK